MIRYFATRITAFLLIIMAASFMIGSKGYSVFLGVDAPFALFTHQWSMGISENHQIAYFAGWIAPPAIFSIVISLLMAPGPTTYGSARWSYKYEQVLMGLFSKVGLILALSGNTLLRSPGNTHVILYAESRSGKGVGVVIPNLLTWGGSLITVDVKLEAWAVTSGFRSRHSECFLFAPGSLQSCSYNALDAIRRDPVFRIGDIQRTASILFPPPAGKQDPMWMSECRNMFMAIVLFLIDTDSEVSLPEVHKFMTKQTFNRDEIEALLSRIEIDELAADMLIKFCDMAQKQRSGVISSAAPMLEIFADPVVAAVSRTTDFSIADLRTRRQSIYLGIIPTEFKRMALLMNLIIQQISHSLISDLEKSQSGHPILFLLDECTAPGRMDEIINASGFYAGYNVRLLLVAQSPQQIIDTYNKEAYEKLRSNIKHRVYFAPTAQPDKEALSTELGKQTVKTKSVSLGRSGRSVSHGHTGRPLMTPDEVGMLGEKRLIILTSNRRPTIARKIRYYTDKRFSRRACLTPPSVPSVDVSNVIKLYKPPLDEPTDDADIIESVEAVFKEAIGQ